jgi:hypothetical protein
MSRKPLLIVAAATSFIVGGLAVAKADDFLAFGKLLPAVDHEAAHYRLAAKAAFTEVLANRAETLGMTRPVNLPTYAPIYPDGMIFYAVEASGTEGAGQVQYAAAAPLRTALDFYEDAAALHHLPFTVTSVGPDTLVFKATDGRRTLQARLNRQFENGTQVDLAYN